MWISGPAPEDFIPLRTKIRNPNFEIRKGSTSLTTLSRVEGQARIFNNKNSKRCFDHLNLDI